MVRRRRVIFLVLVILAGVACQCREKAALPQENSIDRGAFVAVEERQDPAAEWGCNSSVDCVGDYMKFLDRASRQAKPVTKAELEREFRQSGLTAPYRDRLPAEELREAIIERLNIGFLLDGWRERRLEVAVVASEPTPNGTKKRLLFRDPWVGRFPAILLLPAGEGPFPSVVAIHGHGQSADTFLEDFPEVVRLQQQGFAILIPTLRAVNADANEDRVCRAFLQRGFTLLGLHVYEALLCRKYLAYLFGAQMPCGLLGHSGGSVDSSLIIRLVDDFDAAVTDAVGYFIADYHGLIIDEAVPKLHPYHGLIGDPTTGGVPVLAVPYGYELSWDRVFSFLDTHLDDPGRCTSPHRAESSDCW